MNAVALEVFCNGAEAHPLILQVAGDCICGGWLTWFWYLGVEQEMAATRLWHLQCCPKEAGNNPSHTNQNPKQTCKKVWLEPALLKKNHEIQNRGKCQIFNFIIY